MTSGHWVYQGYQCGSHHDATTTRIDPALAYVGSMMEGIHAQLRELSTAAAIGYCALSAAKKPPSMVG